jgi:septum site-determining protein MinD
MEETNLEDKILSLLDKNLMSVSQVANVLDIRKDVAAGYLETLRQQGKLKLFIVGKSNIYTVPREAETKTEKSIRTIGIVSGKGGVGKTVVTINLISALMEFGKNAIAVDADIKMSCLGLQLGMYYFPVTLNDVLKNNTNILNAVYIHSSGIRIIPASLSIDSVDLLKLPETLYSPYFENSFLLIDSPPGLETNTNQVLKACSEAIIVTLPEIPTITDVIKMIDACKEAGTKPIGIIVNRYRKGEAGQINFKEIESVCELPVLGVIPEDKNIRKSIHKKMPVVFFNPYSSSSVAFKKIAAKILGFNYNPSAFSHVKKLFWGLKR